MKNNVVAFVEIKTLHRMVICRSVDLRLTTSHRGKFYENDSTPPQHSFYIAIINCKKNFVQQTHIMATLTAANKANHSALLPAILAAVYTNNKDPNVKLNLNYLDDEKLPNSKYDISLQILEGELNGNDQIVTYFAKQESLGERSRSQVSNLACEDARANNLGQRMAGSTSKIYGD